MSPQRRHSLHVSPAERSRRLRPPAIHRHRIGRPASCASSCRSRRAAEPTPSRAWWPANSRTWGQQMVVENRGGASTNIGTEAVVRADPDGYTMLLQSMPLAVNRFLFPALSYDAISDLAPVSLLCEYANIMAVPVSSPAHSVGEFIAYAKANKGKVTFASSGHGTSVHLSGELFKRMAGIEMLHVPYRS